ncbi:MucR family transcriptional regulator, partial [Methylobacterium sp. J-076]|uniref:MucR family transcriptional regulator n=1 Tax=Methylobacterium sp. J-076 TaxID=2836655 RepID=UPI001FBA4C46
MSGVDSGQTRDLVEAASEIVAAYSSHNHVSASDLPALIASVYASLAGLTTPRTTQEAASASPDKPAPAQIRKSITPDALTSFLDGKPY